MGSLLQQAMVDLGKSIKEEGGLPCVLADATKQTLLDRGLRVCFSENVENLMSWIGWNAFLTHEKIRLEGEISYNFHCI